MLHPLIPYFSRYWLIVGFIFLLTLACQSPKSSSIGLEKELLESAFQTYKEASLTHRRFKYADLEPLIQKRQPVFEVQSLGRSAEGRPIRQLTYGEGETKVLLWSQMHGNESTATMALFDLFNFLEGEGDEFDKIRQTIRENLQLRFIPMVNPDGAEVFQRRNAYGVDLNRDALHLASPEAVLLKDAREAFSPDFGFNLHDQQIYYNVEGTATPATISVLAPPFNEKQEVNEVRARAMQVIVGMNKLLEKTIPGHMGKYDDSFEPRAFGDNFQKWGTSTILIESGGFPGDPDKQYIRKLNFMLILNALHEIATRHYENYAVEDYFRIPDNESQLMDVLIKNVTINRESQHYQVDLGIKRKEVEKEGDYYFRGVLEEIGDLSVYFGYQELDASGMEYVEGKIAEESLDSLSDITREKAIEWLRKGILAVRVKQQLENSIHHLPLLVLYEKDSISAPLQIGSAARFFLKKNGKLRYAVVNGFLIDLENPDVNGLRQLVE